MEIKAHTFREESDGDRSDGDLEEVLDVQNIDYSGLNNGLLSAKAFFSNESDLKE